jgi:hypothetical protein
LELEGFSSHSSEELHQATEFQRQAPVAAGRCLNVHGLVIRASMPRALRLALFAQTHAERLTAQPAVYLVDLASDAAQFRSGFGWKL